MQELSEKSPSRTSMRDFRQFEQRTAHFFAPIFISRCIEALLLSPHRSSIAVIAKFAAEQNCR